MKQHTGGTLPDAVTELLMSQLVAFPQLSFASVPEQSEDKDGEKKGEHEIFEVEQVLGVRVSSAFSNFEFLTFVVFPTGGFLWSTGIPFEVAKLWP